MRPQTNNTRSTISSIRPKFDHRFLVDLRVLVEVATWNSTNQTKMISCPQFSQST